MKSASFFLLFLIISTEVAFSQSDSLTVVKASWVKQKIAPGVRLKQYWFKDSSLFNSNQNISILEIKPRRKIVFDLAYEPQELKHTSTFGKNANAVAALNGTFFDVKNGGSVDLIKADGNIINENRLNKDGERAGHQKSALLFKDGKLSIAKWDGSAGWEKQLDAEDIMVSGPLLIINEQTEQLDTAVAFNKLRHPRTAVALTKKNRILLITVDGRNANAAGMSLFELTNFLHWMKTRDGMNLDGGGSTTLWVNGQPGTGIVNYPTDNKKWDHEGERKVANAVLVKRRR